MFPRNPSVGQTHTLGNVIWTWRNNVWEHSNHASIQRADQESSLVGVEEGDLWIDYDVDSANVQSPELIKEFIGGHWTPVANSMRFVGSFSGNTVTEKQLLIRLFKFDTIIIDSIVEPHNAEDWWIKLVDINGAAITSFDKTGGFWFRGGGGAAQTRTMAGDWLMLLEQGHSFGHAAMHLHITITGNGGPHSRPVIKSEIHGFDSGRAPLQVSRYAVCQANVKISEVSLYFDGQAHLEGSAVGMMS